MSSTCYASVDLCGIRTAKLTNAGEPATGAENGYITNAATTLEIEVVLESGDELVSKNGVGEICAVLNEPDRIKGINLSLELCQLDALLAEIMAGVDVFTDDGDAIGFQYPAVGSTPDPICFEAWSKAWDVDKQATHDSTTAETYIHWVFPFGRWVPGTLTLQHDLMVVPMSCKGSENDRITANGPFDDWPAAVAAHGGVTRVGGWFFDNAMPAAECDYVAVSSAAS